MDDSVQQADDQPHSVQTDGCSIDLWRLCHAKQTHQKTAHGNCVCGERRRKGKERREEEETERREMKQGGLEREQEKKEGKEKEKFRDGARENVGKGEEKKEGGGVYSS